MKLGLRIGEAVSLKWSDIDWEAREIHIHRMESLAEDENEKLKVTICEYTKKKTSKQIVKALSEMNGSDVLMGIQN